MPNGNTLVAENSQYYSCSVQFRMLPSNRIFPKLKPSILSLLNAGVWQNRETVSRKVHTLETVGSTPTSATTTAVLISSIFSPEKRHLNRGGVLLLFYIYVYKIRNNIND